ncbi:hypothetical protein [Chlamydia psittaci]|uniref:hypothetical protein n=1 Tax=Chlamydia psittaci TaxID=83554 RepID=UPI00027E116B|nr:hypothetical protein [Chlamydia psittaci]AFS24820.1 hypothetical protein B602_0757 [Chlamydia psittaci M56]
MLSLSSSCNTPGLQTAVSQQNQNTLDPGPKKIIKLSRKIEGFLEKHKPPASTCYLANPTSSSRVQILGEASCSREVTATLGQQNYPPQGPLVRSSADNFYFDVKEYSTIHGTACTALSLLKTDVRSGIKRRLPIIPGATKQKMQRFCPTSIEESDRQAVRVEKRTRNMLFIAQKVRQYNIFEDRCGAVLDLWHVAPTDTNPKDAQKIWIKTPDGYKSPFCYAKCLNYARTIRCYRTTAPSRGSFLLDENQGSILASSVAYTLGAIFRHSRFKNILLEKETLNNGEAIYVADSVLVQIILLISLVARNAHPYARDVKPEAIFSEDEKNVITLASNIFREQVLGKIPSNKDEAEVSETKPLEFSVASKNSDPWRQSRLDQLSSSNVQEDNFDDFAGEEGEAITPHTAERLLAISSSILNPSPLTDAPPLTPTPGSSPQYLTPSPHGEDDYTFDIDSSPLTEAPPLTPAPGFSPQYLYSPLADAPLLTPASGFSPQYVSTPIHDDEHDRTSDVNSSSLTDAPPLTPAPGFYPQHASSPLHDDENDRSFDENSSPLIDAPPLTPSPTPRSNIYRWYP